MDAVEVGDTAWLLNYWSNIPEHPPRTDVYVLDPRTLEVVDGFNLLHPYPRWARTGDDDKIYIAHGTYSHDDRSDGEGGITRLDPVTGEESHWSLDHQFGGRSLEGFDVSEGRICIAQRAPGAHGLWCLTENGEMSLKLGQEYPVGVLLGNGD